VLITTGRRLAEQGMPRDVDDVVVMLDGRTAFAALPDTDLDLYWGAYLGAKDEILLSGALPAVRDEVVRVRAEARARKGWIMDTYLLRRR
jgi:precorrin-6A synthase